MINSSERTYSDEVRDARVKQACMGMGLGTCTCETSEKAGLLMIRGRRECLGNFEE